MSVTLYSGTPGSGKSFHLVIDILDYLSSGKKVIANFPLNFENIKNKKRKEKYKENFYYVSNDELTVDFLFNFFKNNLIQRKEKQCLLVIDEAQLMFNSREFGKKDRMTWIAFFSQHRKLGFECILVAQYDRMLDRQIRAIIEYEKLHRKLNNYSIFHILPFPVFSVTTFWYTIRLQHGSVDFLMYRPSLAKYYDTYAMFEKTDSRTSLVKAGGN